MSNMHATFFLEDCPEKADAVIQEMQGRGYVDMKYLIHRLSSRIIKMINLIIFIAFKIKMLIYSV